MNKVYEKIATLQGEIAQSQEIIHSIEESDSDKIRLKFETQHWYGFAEPFLGKDKIKVETSKSFLLTIFNTIIENRTKEIDKLIKSCNCYKVGGEDESTR